MIMEDLYEMVLQFMAQVMKNGEPSISGNALAGAYLAKLGFSYKIIASLINVGSKEMNWLSFEWAKALGIRVLRSTVSCVPGTDCK